MMVKSQMRKGMTACCLAVLFLATCVLAILLYQLQTRPEPPLIGTFSTPEFPNGGVRYFVFTKEGTCQQYEQFGPLREGDYSVEGNLITIAWDGAVEQAVFSDGKIYAFHPADGAVIEYLRYSDVPTYVNAPWPDASLSE